MSGSRTTTAHLKFFIRRIRFYQEEFGLQDWAIYIDHENIEDAFACVHQRLDAQVATITLSRRWDGLRPLTGVELDRLALHEMIHILIGPVAASRSEKVVRKLAWILEKKYIK